MVRLKGVLFDVHLLTWRLYPKGAMSHDPFDR